MVFDIVINTPMYGISLAVWMLRENEMRIVDAESRGLWFLAKEFPLEDFFILDFAQIFVNTLHKFCFCTNIALD